MVLSLCPKSSIHFYKHMELSIKQTVMYVERQNRSSLKSLHIANLKGKNWRTELVTWLAAYRSTCAHRSIVLPDVW